MIFTFKHYISAKIFDKYSGVIQALEITPCLSLRGIPNLFPVDTPNNMAVPDRSGGRGDHIYDEKDPNVVNGEMRMVMIMPEMPTLSSLECQSKRVILRLRVN
jgi:hypothetical protein